VTVLSYGASGTTLLIDPELSTMNMKFGATLFLTAIGVSEMSVCPQATAEHSTNAATAARSTRNGLDFFFST
jgi:hypothetical protein